MNNDPGNCNCDTANNEYSKGYDAGMADGYDNIQPIENDNTWFYDGYSDGYEEMTKE